MTPADMLALVGENVLSRLSLPTAGIQLHDDLLIVGVYGTSWNVRHVKTGHVLLFNPLNVSAGSLSSSRATALLSALGPSETRPVPASPDRPPEELLSLRAQDQARLRETAAAQSSLLTGLRMELADAKGEVDRLRPLEVEVAWLRRENVRLSGKSKKPW